VETIICFFVSLINKKNSHNILPCPTKAKGGLQDMSIFNAHQLPQTGYVRLPQIIGNPKANPPIPAVIPISKSSWWQGVKDGRYPAPVKLGPRTTAWRVEDIRALIERMV
jgi:prophage regulatory protein